MGVGGGAREERRQEEDSCSSSCSWWSWWPRRWWPWVAVVGDVGDAGCIIMTEVGLLRGRAEGGGLLAEPLLPWLSSEAFLLLPWRRMLLRMVLAKARAPRPWKEAAPPPPPLWARRVSRSMSCCSCCCGEGARRGFGAGFGRATKGNMVAGVGKFLAASCFEVRCVSLLLHNFSLPFRSPSYISFAIASPPGNKRRLTDEG